MDEDEDEFQIVGVKEFHVAKALIEGHQEQSDNMDSNGDHMEVVARDG